MAPNEPKLPLMHALGLGVLLALSFFVGLGAVPLFDKDEGAFSAATRYMVESGNYAMTYLNGEPRYDKPILIYWLQAASIHALGLNEFALRLPSAIAAAVWVVFTFLFARRHYGVQAAFFAALFLAGSVQTTIIGKAAIADAVLNACIAATLFSIWRYLEGGRKRDLYIAFAAAGLGMLTKGPLALLVPGLATLAFYPTQQPWKPALRAWLRDAFNPIGILIFIAINLPWYTYAVWDQGWPILQDWFGKQLFARVGGDVDGHGGPLHYYLPVLLVGLLPWTGLFLLSGRRIREAWRQPLDRFLWLWFIGVFVFFSIMSTKLPHYVIYGYTPLFVLMGARIASVKRGAWWLVPALLLLALLALAPMALPFAEPHAKDATVAEIMRAGRAAFGPSYFIALGAGLAILAALFFVPQRWRALQVWATAVVVVCAVNFVVFPRVASVMQVPIRDAAQYARSEGLELVKWKFNQPSFVYYFGDTVPERIPQPGMNVVTKPHELEKFRDLGGFEILFEAPGVVIVRIDADAALPAAPATPAS